MTQWLIVHVSTEGLYRIEAEKALQSVGFDTYRKSGDKARRKGDKDFCFIQAEYNCSWGVNIEAFAARCHLEALEAIRKVNPAARMTSEWKFEDSCEWEIYFEMDEPQETFTELLKEEEYDRA